MADQYAEPSKNPADQKTLMGTLNTFLRKFLQDVDDCLPATIIAYNRTSNVATVHPQIMVLKTDKTTQSRAQYAQIPVLGNGGGGIGINFPLQPGDTGWIKATDRDISLYIQSLTEQQPNTRRFHSFNDGWFIPDYLRKMVIDPEDENAAVFQLYSNSTKVSINRNGTLIAKSGGSKLTMLNGIITVDYTTATFNGTTTTINSNVIINGNVDMNSGYVKSDGVPIDETHTHGGVTSGPSSTGTPNP